MKNRKYLITICTALIFSAGISYGQCTIVAEGCGGGGYEWTFTAATGQTINDLFTITGGPCVLLETIPGTYTLTCFDPDPNTTDPNFPLCVIGFPGPCDPTTTTSIAGIGDCAAFIAGFDCAGDACDTQPGGCTTIPPSTCESMVPVFVPNSPTLGTNN